MSSVGVEAVLYRLAQDVPGFDYTWSRPFEDADVTVPYEHGQTVRDLLTHYPSVTISQESAATLQASSSRWRITAWAKGIPADLGAVAFATELVSTGICDPVRAEDRYTSLVHSLTFCALPTPDSVPVSRVAALLVARLATSPPATRMWTIAAGTELSSQGPAYLSAAHDLDPLTFDMLLQIAASHPDQDLASLVCTASEVACQPAPQPAGVKAPTTRLQEAPPARGRSSAR